MPGAKSDQLDALWEAVTKLYHLGPGERFTIHGIAKLYEGRYATHTLERAVKIASSAGLVVRAAKPRKRPRGRSQPVVWVRARFTFPVTCEGLAARRGIPVATALRFLEALRKSRYVHLTTEGYRKL